MISIDCTGIHWITRCPDPTVNYSNVQTQHVTSLSFSVPYRTKPFVIVSKPSSQR